MEKIAILGSTGSIGENTLSIVRTHPERFRVQALAARRNVKKLAAQALEFKPKVVCLFDKDRIADLEKELSGSKVRILSGEEGLLEITALPGVQKVICAMVGACGLKPIFNAVRQRKNVAIANKEPLVMAGTLLMKEARQSGAAVLPIDSEHSGLWQCLEGQKKEAIQKLILTSSGGPFRTHTGSFEDITPEEALNHPKWKMGAKITIDSATLMNKGLEVIEAANLFDMPAESIEVLVHPEAVVHALVEFVDGSYLANLGVTDMRVPIQYALSYPERLINHLPRLDFAKISSLRFEKPDFKRFPCLALGYEASRTGGTVPAVLNAANEAAVEAFLDKQIGFTDIPRILEKVMSLHSVRPGTSVDEILEADAWAREEAHRLIADCKKIFRTKHAGKLAAV